MIPQILEWARHNKLVVFFGITTTCLFVSTIALSTQKGNTQLMVCNQQAFEKHYSNGTRTHCHVEEDNRMNANYRLPRHIVPTNYKLELRPNMTTKTLEGTVLIHLHVLEPTKKIKLHIEALTIETVTAKGILNQDVGIETGNLYKPDEWDLLNVQLINEIPMGNYTLEIKFKRSLDHTIVGLYSSTLKNGRTMVASKFQPTYARRAFPCFDEPEFKATYDITLVKPLSYVALSNMNEISKTIDKEKNTEIVTFATSVPMSTYLACFVICDFDFQEAEINASGIGNNFKLRSFAQKDQLHKIDFAQDIGKRATEFYIQYYEVPFPLPKLDMIAIPDYVSGATEHWGLITYRETSFLIDQKFVSSKNKVSVANTIAHELAHMWFGNLVTMKWWDDLWLNEGFASYMQVKSLNAIEPSWTMLDQFLIKSMHSVLVTDAKLSSHPIVQTVETPDQITAIFDSISYNKGASVLRMLEGFIGEENFRRGVSDYLKKFEFGNTVTQDLLNSLVPYFKKENPDLNLTYIMDTWTRQMGYPLLTVSRSKDEPETYVITQTRFLLDPEAVYENDSQFGYRWFVPITYKTDQETSDNILWFPNSAQSVNLKLRSGAYWLKLNNNQVGYYRVNYSVDMWERLIEELKNKSEQLTISDRAHLLNDVFALAEAGAVPYQLALDLTTYLGAEEDYVPWEAAAAVFSSLGDRLLNSSAYDDLQKYIQILVKPLHDKQSWPWVNLPVIEGLLRNRILSLAARWGLPDAESIPGILFRRWLFAHGTPGSIKVDPDLGDIVYYYGMKNIKMEEWDKVWGIYLEEEDAQEQVKYRRGLSAASDISILKKYLTLAWDEKNVRSQDYLIVLQYIAANPAGTDLVWDDVRARWPLLVERFSLNSRYLGNLIPSITGDFSTVAKLEEMKAFFAQYPEAGAGEAARRRALETVRNNIRWRETHMAAVATWLRNRPQIMEL